MAEQDSPPPTVTAMKIPIIKKGEYDIWSMRMRQYIYHTDHNLWDIIVDGDLQEEAAPAGEQSSPPAPKTAKQLTAKRNQERVKSILLLAIPDEYLLKFHNVLDAKSLWVAIKSRFGGNDESKKIQRNVLKHQFENFTTAPSESLDKAYDRFQKLISQLEVHAALVSREYINQKFLRSLPPSWSQIDLIMRNKPDIDQTDIDDLYNNLMVYKDEMKRSSSSTSNSQNLAFLSSENTSSTNEVSTASGNFGVNIDGGTNSSSQVSSTLGTDEVVCSFFAQQTTSPPLDNDDLQQIDQDYLEELDIRWKVAMLTIRVQRFIKKTRRNLDFKGKQPVTFDKRNATINEPSSQALIAQDGLGGYDWSNDFDEPVNYALMTISSSSSLISSDNEGYELALESLESRILGHEKNELKKLLRKKDELKVKIEKWEESSKGLNKLLNSKMSDKDKNSLGYGTQLDEISNKSETDSEISMSVFEVRSSDEEITPANDRFFEADGYHAVPPPITRNFLTPGADISFAGLDEYAIRKKIIKSKTTKLNIDTSKSKTSETIGKTNEVNIEKPKSVHESVVPKPKINRDKVIIEDWYSDDEDDVSEVNTVSPVKTNETQTVKTQVDKIAKKSPEPKLKTMVNTGQRVVKLVWDNAKKGNPEICLQDHAVVDSGCSSHMTGNKAYLSDYEDYNGGFVAFGSDPKGGKITGKGKIRTANLDFDDVYFVDELKFNLFSVSQMCDKKNSVLFTDTECLILSPSFKLLDENQVVLRAPRQNGVYSLDLKNIVPSGGITCLYANATTDESKLWHRRLGHVNFKNINKLVKGHLVRGLPSKVFVNDHTCVACKKGKQHKASCKAKLERTIRKPLELLHMDLFGPVSVESINKKKYCLVVTDDFSRFSWVFFLATKDETNEILYKFITGLENQLNHKVKIIRSDHGTEFKNHAMNEFCAKKGIKREFSVARTPQQNGKPPSISFMRPFGCPLTILNTLDPLGKFDRKSDEGYLLGYSTTSKAFRVYNKRTKRVEENMHIDFLEDQPNVAGSGPDWMFDLDFLTNTMNYIPVSVENQVNVDAGTQEHYVAGSSEKDKEPTQEYILLPLHPHRLRISVEDVVQAAQEKPSENSPKDNDAHDSEDVAEKEEQHIQLQVELQAEVERERQRKEEASKAAIAESKKFNDDISEEHGWLQTLSAETKVIEEIKKVLEEPDSIKAEVKQKGHEDSTRKRPGRRLRMKATKKYKRQKTDSDLEEEEQLKAFLMIVPDEEEIINYEVLKKSSLGRFKDHVYANAEDEIWQNQERWNLKIWDLYENYGVHTLILEDGTKIRMLAEKKYPLTKETLERMFSLRLVARTASEDTYTLLIFIQKQIDEYGNIKNWLVQKQTAFGKDFSNPFTADSLLKTICAPCYSNEALVIPEQTATGKEISNPFMVGEDCWVLEDFTTYYCWFYIGAASKDLVLLFEDVITKTVEYCLFDVVVGFHRGSLLNKCLTIYMHHLRGRVYKLHIYKKTPIGLLQKGGRRLQRYDLQLIMCDDIVKDSKSYLKSRGSIEDFVSFREMITSQLQGKLWLYDEVRTRLCLFCHHQIGEDCWDS
ncbi:putative ribonuclease H-like domain-containing protein [Tanacetum coccineum]